MKKKLKVKVRIDDKFHEFFMKIDSHETTPTDDEILNLFSLHYHKGTRRNLPKNCEVISVEDAV